MKIGEILIQHNLITEAQLSKALDAQKSYGGKLGTNLVELGFVSELEFAKILAQQIGLPPCSPLEFDDVPPSVIDKFEADFVREQKIMPLSMEDAVRVAICDPYSLDAVKEYGKKINREVEIVIAPEIWIIAALERYYGIAREQRYEQHVVTDEAFQGELMDISSSIQEIFKNPDSEAPQMQSIEEFGQTLVASLTPLEVLNALFQFLTPVFPQMAVYAVKAKEISGWTLCGFPVYTKKFSEQKLPRSAPSVFNDVIESSDKVICEIPRDPNHHALVGALEIAPETEVGLYPILFKGRTLAVLLGIPRKGTTAPKPVAGNIVQDAVAKVGAALEIQFLKKQILGRASATDR